MIVTGKRARPARGAESPSASERGWGPASSEKDHEQKERRVSNGEINRELTTLKRIFNLARPNGKLIQVPHIPMLKERNVRTGFFEREQLERVLDLLPPAVRPAVQFAYITGWRIPSEVLPLQWRHVDFEARVVRLDPDTTRNDEGRTFPFTDALQQLLEAQKAEHDRRECDLVEAAKKLNALHTTVRLPPRRKAASAAKEAGQPKRIARRACAPKRPRVRAATAGTIWAQQPVRASPAYE